MENRPFIENQPSIRRNATAVVAILSLAMVVSCAKKVEDKNEADAEKNRAAAAMPMSMVNQEVYDFYHTNFPTVSDSNLDIPGYNDEQRLPGAGGNTYGDVARLYAALSAPTTTDMASASGGFAGLIEVIGDAYGGTNPVPDSYRLLNIANPGAGVTNLYCVILQGTSPNFDGYVVPVQSNKTCAPIGQNQSLKLSVEFDSSISDVTPYTVRFLFDANNLTAIGVGCASGFCHIGRGVGMGKKALGDEQALAIPSTGGGLGVSRTDMNGQIRPETHGALTTTPTLVATITLGSALPTGTNAYRTWGLNPNGDTGVWLTKTGTGANTVYTVQFSATTPTSSTNPTAFPVVYTDHSTAGVPIPAAVRWAWNDHDEDVWLACDQGCCTVGGGGDGMRGRGRGNGDSAPPPGSKKK